MHNTNVRLYSKLKTDSDFEQHNLENSRLQYDACIEDCLVYYGMPKLACVETAPIVNGDGGAVKSEPSDILLNKSSPFRLKQHVKDVAHAAMSVAAAANFQIDLQFEPTLEHCLTMFHLKSNQMNLLCFASRQKTLGIYSSLLRLNRATIES